MVAVITIKFVTPSSNTISVSVSNKQGIPGKLCLNIPKLTTGSTVIRTGNSLAKRRGHNITSYDHTFKGSFMVVRHDIM